jgi:hypothetical protein
MSDEMTPPGFTFLRIVTVATSCVGGVIIVSFLVEWCMGTLSADDVWRFIPKAAFGAFLMASVWRKTQPKSKA